MTERNVEAATSQMVDLLKIVAPQVLAETFNYYRGAPTTDGQGNKKYTGILYRFVNTDGVETDVQIGELIDRAQSEVIIGNKILCMQEGGFVTSIEGRDPSRNPPFWGGASFSEIDTIYEGTTGGTELQDHLLTCGAQKSVGAISPEVYETWTSLQHPGIVASIDDSSQFGLHPGVYMALKASIEAYFRAAEKQIQGAV